MMKFLALTVLILSSVAVSHAFNTVSFFSLRSSQHQKGSICGLRMASTVQVTIQEKNGNKVITCEKEEVLRTAMLQNKVELYYTMKGKLWNCNGGGNCGTCKVELVSGSVTPRTDAEKKLLANDPSTYRLACQTCVLGPVVVRNKPDAA